MAKLNLYSVFYLNLMFSSVGVEDRMTVIKKCYWPLLDMIEKGFQVGVQPSGTTLEIIKELDPAWIERFKKLLDEKKCELIGDGYAHIIGPLVPAEINRHNQVLGLDIYKNILNIKPEIATINEMAYSAGLVEHFLETGYKAILMDWNNPARFHPEWKKEWRYHPQTAVGNGNKKIPMIWSNCIAFQKFQRYVNGVIEIDEYLEYIRSHKENSTERFFMLYGSDTEIFDFRTRRFASKVEGKLVRGEWDRIYKLFEALSREDDIQLILPSEVLKCGKDKKNSFNEIKLESPEDPIPVKKQEKYNITRWGLTSHSVEINTKCYRVYQNLKRLEKYKSKKETEKLWKELCFLWSSDFRTHIERGRFLEFQKRLSRVLKLTGGTNRRVPVDLSGGSFFSTVKRTRRQLEIESNGMKIVLNCHKGLTIDSLIFKKISDKPLLGGIAHGFYDDIRFGVDFFSGHSVIAIPGTSQMTDLSQVSPKVLKEKNKIVVTGRASVTGAGRHQEGGGYVEKTITLFPADNKVELACRFNFSSADLISWRSGFTTLRPEAFDARTLFFACHNGGKSIEKFSLRDVNAIDKNPVSLMVSAPSSLGNTSGRLEMGDAKKKIIIATDMGECAALPMIHFQRLPETFFLRSFYSLGETDDTGRLVHRAGKEKHTANFTMTISAEKTA